MKWSQVKTIMIFMLIGIDLVFAGNLLLLIREHRREQAQAVETAVSLIAQKDVLIKAEEIPGTEGRTVLHAARDPGGEMRAAESLLGVCAAEQPGGGMILYQAETREAFFRNGGFVELHLLEKAGVSEEKDAVRAVETLMDQAGFSPEEMTPQATKTASGWQVICLQEVESRPVFNGSWTAAVAEEEWTLVGRWITADKLQRGKKAKSAAELLLALPSVVKNGNSGAVTIDRIEEGWLAATAQDGGVDLIPVWRLKSADAHWYIDLSTGNVAIPE